MQICIWFIWVHAVKLHSSRTCKQELRESKLTVSPVILSGHDAWIKYFCKAQQDFIDKIPTFCIVPTNKLIKGRHWLESLHIHLLSSRAVKKTCCCRWKTILKTS